MLSRTADHLFWMSLYTERAVKRAVGALSTQHRVRAQHVRGSLPSSIKEAFERALIADALRRHGSLARTAEALAIAKTTLHDKIRKYGLGEGSPA
jgi:DNA-binding NtrC family response regulator